MAAYLVLYNAVSLVRLVPVVGNFSYLVDLCWNRLVFGTERVVLGMQTVSSIKITGSGDTEFQWVRNGCMLVLALCAATVWSFFDRRRQWEPAVHEFLRISVRYVLAATLIGYGMAKLLAPGQFPTPGGSRLLEPIGRLSPMGMLWVFMGASKAYRVFSGIMELSGGMLLFWRRTTPLGALVSTGVLLNIVLLNFCYDVPVKLYSMNLLLMAGFLLGPDLRRFAGVLILNRPTPAASLAPPWDVPWYGVSSVVIKVVVLSTLLVNNAARIWEHGDEYKAAPAALVQLSGFWNVEKFKRDGVELPQLITDAERWRRVILEEHSGGLRLIALGASNQWIGSWMVGPGSTEGMLLLSTDSKEDPVVTFALAHPAADETTISGDFKGHAIVVSLKQADKIDTRLFNRGFHWVSEEPFNR